MADRTLSKRSSGRIRDKIQETANAMSYWSQPVREDVQHKYFHLVAVFTYAVGMLLFIIYSAVAWVNYPTPSVFESAESNVYAPVPLHFAIDCQDCRVVPGVPGQLSRPGVPKAWVDKATLWILEWDYTSVPGGCAARSPGDFDTALREFCAAQHREQGAVLREPLDKCRVKNTDLALLRRSKSPDARLASTADVSWRRGWGGNPNYGNGSMYELLSAVPLCFVNDLNARSNSTGDTQEGLRLKILNIPHHAFAAGAFIGRAVVSVSSADKMFREERVFQPWHANTLHLGLTVKRNAKKEVMQKDGLRQVTPWFANFQYDGRVEWGLEEGDHENTMGYFRDKYLNAMRLTEHETRVMDIAIGFGLMTLPDALNATRTENGTLAFKQKLARVEAGLPPNIMQYIDRLLKEGIAPGDVFQYVDPENADLTSPIHFRRRLSGAIPTHVQRRRLSGHDEWGGVEYNVRLSHYANVYTAGRKPYRYEVIASVGGASSSLIGLIGFFVASYEFFMRCTGRDRSNGKMQQVAQSSSNARDGAEARVGMAPVLISNVEQKLEDTAMPTT